MKHLLSAAAASALMAGTAFAGNIEPAPAEPVIAPAPMPVYTSPDWSGFYAGGQMGYADVTGKGHNDGYTQGLMAVAPHDFKANGDGFIGGITLGYDHDFGDWVAGVGADYDWTDINLGSGNKYAYDKTKLESIWRLKARAGYKIGDGLLYATGGYAQADTKDYGSEDGWFIGAGYEYLITEQFSLGGEILYHEFNDFTGTNVSDYDMDVTTAQVRATFRF